MTSSPPTRRQRAIKDGDDLGVLPEAMDKKGKVRYTAVYFDSRGRRFSAGTFSNKTDSDKAWQREEVRIREGRAGDPVRGRQTFERYVTDVWLPNHVMEATTREGYAYSIDKHIIPWFGGMKMVEILPSDVREWVTDLTGLRVTSKHAEGNEEEIPALSPATIRSLKNMLSAIFTIALNDQVIFLHPCKGVKTPTVPVRPPSARNSSIRSTTPCLRATSGSWRRWISRAGCAGASSPNYVPRTSTKPRAS
jgi:hypothetical protein